MCRGKLSGCCPPPISSSPPGGRGRHMGLEVLSCLILSNKELESLQCLAKAGRGTGTAASSFRFLRHCVSHWEKKGPCSQHNPDTVPVWHPRRPSAASPPHGSLHRDSWPGRLPAQAWFPLSTSPPRVISRAYGVHCMSAGEASEGRLVMHGWGARGAAASRAEFCRERRVTR